MFSGVGEFFIEGLVVGIGYLGEFEKIVEVFIENFSWLVKGYGLIFGWNGRFYKIGDFVWYEDNIMNGFIEFVGRKD